MHNQLIFKPFENNNFVLMGVWVVDCCSYSERRGHTITLNLRWILLFERKAKCGDSHFQFPNE
jgi:hypothetical protein